MIFDLFCGAGGVSEGITSLGLPCVGFDKWEDAVRTHSLNGHATVLTDLSTQSWSGISSPDMLWASPPCQSFSVGGLKAGENDSRNQIPAFIRAVEELEPYTVFFENVKSLGMKYKYYFDEVLDKMYELGYDVEYKFLNSANYGVPQTRERLFMIASRKAIKWPEPTHTKSTWVSMKDALGIEGLVGFPRKDDGRAGGATLNGYRARDLFPTSRPSPTIGEKARSWSVWTSTGRERFTLEQGKKLMGFRDDFEFWGSRTSQFLQLGNSVPPPMAASLIKAML